MAPYLHVTLELMHAETNPVKNISTIFVSWIVLRFEFLFIKWALGCSVVISWKFLLCVRVHCRSGAPVSLRPIKEFSFIYSFNSWPIPKQMSLSLDSTFSPEMPWSSKGIHMSTKLVTLNQEFKGRCVRQFLKISSWNGCAADIVFLAIRFSPADE